MKYANKSIPTIDRAIIQYLISCRDYCTSYDIAVNAGINRRQVRTEMNVVKDILADFGFTLDSKRSKGYFIVERTDIDLLADMINESDTEYSSLSTAQGRRRFILQYLIDHDDEYTKPDELADMLFVSRSTINNDVEQRNIWISYRPAAPGLKIETVPHEGILLVGPELSKREIACDMLFDLFGHSGSLYTYLDMFINENAPLESSIVNTIKRFGIGISDTALLDFMIYISFVCRRLVRGKTLDSSPDISAIESREEFDVSRVIGNLISNYFNMQVNVHEINRIAIKLMSRRSSMSIQPEINDPTVYQIASECFHEIYDHTRIVFEGENYFNIFNQYIYTTSINIFYGEKVRNPLYADMRDNYPLAYNLALIVSGVFERHTGTFLSSSHLAFFTTFFNTWIDEMKHRHQKTLLIVANGRGASESVRQEILFNLGYKINITDMCMYHEMKEYDLNDYSCIISTVPIRQKLAVPVINISQYVVADDINRINDFLTTNYSNFQPLFVMPETLFRNDVAIINEADCHIALSNLICNVFTKLHRSYVESIIASDQNYISSLPNGITMIRLSKSISAHSFVSAIIPQNEIVYQGHETSVLMLVSSGNKTIDLFSAMQESARGVDLKQVEEVRDSAGTYADFISLFLKENQFQ